RAALERKLVRAQRVSDAHDQFLPQSDNTWSFMGEERGAEAHRTCEAALASFGVLEHPYWCKDSPAADLTDKQKQELHRESYRLLLFLAVRHIQEGVETVGNPAAATTGVTKRSASEAALEALDKAQAMEQGGLVKPSKAVPVLTSWAKKLANFSLSDIVRSP